MMSSSSLSTVRNVTRKAMASESQAKADVRSMVLGILVLTLLWTTPCQCRSATFQRMTYLDDNVIYTPSGDLEDTLVAQRTSVTSTSLCAALCLTEERCSSFFHVAADGLCLMHSIVFLNADEATAKPGTTYWRLSQEDCPQAEGYLLYRPLGLCYKYYWQSVFWDDAESICSSAGTSLIKVDSQDKFQHLYQFLRGSTVTRAQHVSIGMSEKSGSYRWVDGSNVTWFNWASTEPSSSAEQCVNMAWFYYFKWNDVPCAIDTAAKYNFLCQKLI